MARMKSQTLKFWESYTNKLAKEFISKYFCRGKEIGQTDWYWIADEVGGVIQVGDYFFDLQMIVDAMRYNTPAIALFSFYDYSLKQAEAGKNKEYNLKSWTKLRKK